MPIKRPICKSCNKNFCAINYKRDNITHYRSMCENCIRKKNKQKPRGFYYESSGYQKKNVCDVCGFKSIFSTQMTVFHIDGSLRNAELNNLRTVCLNCVEVVKKKEVNWRRGDLQVDY